MYSAMGTKLKKGTTAVANLTSIGGLDLSADTIETTTLDSPDGFRTYTGGLKDGGDVSLSGYFDPTSHEGLYTDFGAGTQSTYTIEFPMGAKWTFEGIVTGYNTGAEMEDNVSFEATIKVSGKPTLTVPPAV
jgi:predicted secreted protein